MGYILRSYFDIAQTNNSLIISSNLSTQSKHQKKPLQYSLANTKSKDFEF
jgi:hypothetical protein